jgi:hypothetical protein
MSVGREREKKCLPLDKRKMRKRTERDRGLMMMLRGGGGREGGRC